MKQVVGGFIIKKNKFLFAKRNPFKKWAPSTWDIVGGHVKKNESLLDALKRETKEELNIDVLQARLIDKYEIFDDSIEETFQYYIYFIVLWKGKPVNNSKEHTKIKWLTKEKLNTKKLALPLYLSIIHHSL